MNRLFYLPICIGIIFTSVSCNRSLVLTSDGASDYTIVIPTVPTEIERKAATEFQRLLALSSSVEVSIAGDTLPKSNREIVIGLTNRTPGNMQDSLQEDGFVIRTEGRSLLINGGSEKGTLYGVYTFFDKYLGYRCYSPKVFKYPTLDRVEIASGINDRQVPVNRYRNTFYDVASDPFYADWHKLDHMKPDWGLWVHTFATLLPPEQYFAQHPECYALVNGKRVGMQDDGHLRAQLCLSNPETLEILCDNLKKEMDRQPDALYWSVSQNDTYADKPYNCTCPACSALDEKAGSPSGSVLDFVNRVAERFPDKIISTLAYRYTRTAPKGVVPADNVNIMLCDIECNRHIPIAEDSTSASFRNDFEEWGKIANNILMWDYIIQFSNLMAPYPNLRTLQPNMQYFVRNGVTAQFQQGNISRGGEFCELRPYLVARLMWNPDVDIRAEMEDFLNGYYEEAGPSILAYIDLMHDELEKSKLPLSIYGKPFDHFEGFLRPELFSRYEELFDQAEAAVADKAEVLERVKIARLPLTFSLFEIAKQRGLDEDRVFEQVEGKWQIRPEISQRLDTFLELCRKAEIQHFVEGGMSPEEYGQQTRQALNAFITE